MASPTALGTPVTNFFYVRRVRDNESREWRGNESMSGSPWVASQWEFREYECESPWSVGVSSHGQYELSSGNGSLSPIGVPGVGVGVPW
jgi:hypothetical protein